MYNLNGQVALVTGTGGQNGIGRAIATRLAREGADVILNDIAMCPYSEDENPNPWGGMSAVVKEIEAIGQRAITIVADVSDADQVNNMATQALEKFGHIDILVNNAGAPAGSDRVPLVDLEEEDWDMVHRVNVKGTFLCCRAIARHMIDKNQGGKIINISSLAGKRGIARYAAYCSSKFAVIGLTESLAKELAPHRINVNAICPGLVDTERVDHIASAIMPKDLPPAEKRDQLVQQATASVPLKRIAQGSDVANMAAFLASSESDYLTGLAITVAGGS